MHGLHGTYHMLRNPFGSTPIELLDDMCHKDSCFGQKPLLKHLMIILGEEAQVEGRFDLFGDSAKLDAR